MKCYVFVRDSTTRFLNWAAENASVAAIIAALIVPVFLLAILFGWVASFDEKTLLALILIILLVKR